MFPGDGIDDSGSSPDTRQGPFPISSSGQPPRESGGRLFFRILSACLLLLLLLLLLLMMMGLVGIGDDRTCVFQRLEDVVKHQHSQINRAEIRLWRSERISECESFPVRT